MNNTLIKNILWDSSGREITNFINIMCCNVEMSSYLNITYILEIYVKPQSYINILYYIVHFSISVPSFLSSWFIIHDI